VSKCVRGRRACGLAYSESKLAVSISRNVMPYSGIVLPGSDAPSVSCKETDGIFNASYVTKVQLAEPVTLSRHQLKSEESRLFT
jgi:hypothetical protein